MSSTLEYQTLSPRSARNSPLAFLAQLGPLIGLILIIALFSILRSRTFLSSGNTQIILINTAVVATVALGMTIVIVSGGIDLSVGSTVALTTVVIALLLRAGWPPWLAALGGIAAAAICGLLVGLLVAYVRLAPFIVTLGTWGAYRGIAVGLAKETLVRPPKSTWMSDLLTIVEADHWWMRFSVGIWLVLGIALLVAGALRFTRIGRHVYAIGSNEQTARLCGIPVNRTKVLIYVAMGVFAGLGGVLQFGRLTEGDPTTANGLELSVIAAVVIGGASLNGGQGSIFGTLVGALLMMVVDNGCGKFSWMHNWIQQIITGAIIIIAAAIDRFQHKRDSA
ncbi:MAG TPA: ABC transporter permease [Tepidisphaeraceae bacterium]|jgi:ribose/xylose/arabinose/galactoside ABC-type transport system permease subunit|nr:ABC transporter permease [Tepidisphaeraceae bacterium]